MITNASDTKIGTGSNLPNVMDALSSWLQKMTVSYITKSIEDFLLKEVETTVSIMAVRQPFTTKQLLMKPEGQRAWN